MGFVRRDTDWHTVADEREAFYLRIAAAGSVPLPGSRSRDPGDAGPVHGRGAQADRSCAAWITGIKAQFASVPPGADEPPLPSPSRSASRCSSRSSASRPGNTATYSRSGPSRSSARPEWRGGLRGEWPRYESGSSVKGRPLDPPTRTSVRMLRAHMPELVPAYERVVELAGGGDLAARMLSLYKPPPYLAGVLPGRLDAGRRSAPRSQLRLRAVAARGLVWSTRRGSGSGSRHERLPVGPPRRDQRGRPGRLAHVRRPPGARRRVRRPARPALPAGDVLDGRRGGGRAGAAPLPPAPTT